MKKFHLITRPLDVALPFQQLLINHLQPCLINPLLEVTFDLKAFIDFINNEDLTNCSFIVTSINSLKAIKQIRLINFQSINLIISSSASIQEAKDLGFKSVIQVGNQAKDIEKYLQHNYDTNIQYVYLCGEDITVKIDETLNIEGLNLRKIIVYKTQALTLTISTIKYFKKNLIKSVSLFSYKTAQIFIYEIRINNLENDLSLATIYTISNKIANYIKNELTMVKVMVSDCYNSKSMVNLIIKEEV